MIDLVKAKDLVTGWLRATTEAFGSELRIIDEETEEHEWGWVIHWEQTGPTASRRDQHEPVQLPYIVDRVTGRVRPVGTYGLKISIAKLLQERQTG